MGDSENVVAEILAGYSSAAYGSDANSNATPEAPAYAAPGGNAYSIDANSAGQDAHADMGYVSIQGVGADGAADHVADYEHGPTEASQAAGYNSSANGAIDSEAGKVTSAENGNVVDAEQQFVDGSDSAATFAARHRRKRSRREIGTWQLIRRRESAGPVYFSEEMEDDCIEGQALVVSNNPVMVDTSAFFRTSQEFVSSEAVVEWARKCGRRNGIVVVINRSDINDPNRAPRIFLGCERSGTYKGKSTAKSNVKRRKTSTKKCGCPFSLKAGISDPVNGRWRLVVLNGNHNHTLVKSFEGHSYVGRLNKEEKETVERLSKSGLKTKDILNHIKSRDPTNVSTVRTIYNARTLLRIHESAGRSHMQQLFKLLQDHGYVTRHRCEGMSEVVLDLFWSSSSSVQLARAFPFVFMMDCTYKSSKYRLPLLQIVGVTSTSKTFTVAFCYLNAEKEENYRWAVQCLKDLLDPDVLPGVFITDCELPLMNALNVVFPNAKNLLCRVHIQRDVLSKCVRFFPHKSQFDEFLRVFTAVMHSSTIDEYDKNVQNMDSMFKDFPNAVNYVHESWLSKYKTNFVSAWIDNYFHLGNTSTSRVESSSAKLKKYLACSVQGFVQSFQKIHILLEGQLIDIKASFEESLTRVPLRFRNNFYKELTGFVSTAALECIEREMTSMGSVGVDAKKCIHSQIHSLGLPCPHMLTKYRDEGKSIPLSGIHGFWKKLSLLPFNEGRSDEISIEPELQILCNTFQNASVVQKLEIKKKLQQLSETTTITDLEPNLKVHLVGIEETNKAIQRTSADDHSGECEPLALEHAFKSHVFEDAASTQELAFEVRSAKKLPKLEVHRIRNAEATNWVAMFPFFLQKYITNVIDVPGDGHCGYRVVASFNGWLSDGWKQVRADLTDELLKNKQHYDNVLSPFSSTFELLASVECSENTADTRKWMMMPYMGNVVSTCYKVVVVLLSQEQCLTFFPMRDPMPVDYNQELLVFGHVSGSHFVRLELAADCPLPPVSKMWLDHHQPSARGWSTMFAERMEKFKNIVDQTKVATVEYID